MMMEQKCPHCGAGNLEFYESDDEWVSDNECIRQWDVRCEKCGKGFIISEVLTVTSRLVAKDDKELDALIVKEEEEDYKRKY